MSTYPINTTAPKQPLPRSLPVTHIQSKATVDHWLSQEQRSHPHIMSNDHFNNDSFSPFHPRADDDYTITTQPPSEDQLTIWPTHNNLYHPEAHTPLNIQTTGYHRFTPSPTYTDSWAPNYYNASNEQASDSHSYIMGNGFSPESTLSPYSMQPRTPSSLPQLSPTHSDPTLSPLYSASPRLPTPSTPGSVNQSFIPSPTLSDLNLVSLDPQATTGNSDKPRFTHREQLQKFREAMSLPGSAGIGPFVPQQMYKPHTTSDRKRYVEEVMLEGPLYFVSEHNQFGISLKDALHSRTKKLLDRDQVVFEGRGPSVSIRLEWPGYRQWSRQIPTKDFRSPPQPITLAKLAKNVAKCVQRFMLDRKTLAMEEDADQRWRIGDGPDDIKLEDLVLVSIHHVSLGSWQPHLRLVRPLRPRHGHSNSLTLPPTPMTASNASASNMPFSALLQS
ncbi:hypothetical protein GALMADRAFT_222164 [Galerina marginata CBS 339.88]|uniref:Uncharacterized protein n=1 Tax=Galerina marginata (strain CBS 339.88) TaxID=685588 RepID=A0A067TE00_GALM3|nr:hypothetical protein GALMADRAFT_222164 [Galerina marginata CBS 339.88]